MRSNSCVIKSSVTLSNGFLTSRPSSSGISKSGCTSTSTSNENGLPSSSSMSSRPSLIGSPITLRSCSSTAPEYAAPMICFFASSRTAPPNFRSISRRGTRPFRNPGSAASNASVSIDALSCSSTVSAGTSICSFFRAGPMSSISTLFRTLCGGTVSHGDSPGSRAPAPHVARTLPARVVGVLDGVYRPTDAGQLRGYRQLCDSDDHGSPMPSPSC